jgi:hypothetical protein
VTSIQARIADSIEYGGIKVVLEQRSDSGRTIWGPGWPGRGYLVRDGEAVQEGDVVTPLVLRDDEARALLAGLQRWYGESVDDSRLLRADYVAERARVDKFIEALLGSGALR